MSIPRDVLETLPPISYPALRDSLRDGDIVLCQGRDPFSRLIQWSTKSCWSHVGMVFRVDSLEQVIVIEAVEKIGVRAVALADFLSRDSAGTHPYPGKILFVRHKKLKGDVTDPRVVEMAKFAFAKLGCKFAPGEIAKIAMRIIDALAQHLEAAANAHELAAIAQMTADRLRPALLFKPAQIVAGILAARQDDQIRRRDRLAGADHTQVDAGMGAQGMNFGRKGKATLGEGGIDQGLYSQAIPRQKKLALFPIPQGKGEHAHQLGQGGGPFAHQQAQQDFRIRIGAERLPDRNQIGP